MNAPALNGPTLVELPRYLGSVRDYARSVGCGRVVCDTRARFDKRLKEVHRCTIADTHGLKQLTVPIEKPLSMTGARWDDIVVSGHGAWWHVHWETLKSAYGRTPFFEYYADDFSPLFTEESVGMRIVDFDRRLDELVRRLMQLDTPVTYGPAPTEAVRAERCDVNVHDVDYYQVRALKHGFLPGLSIVDLLFNMGPESVFVLERMAGLTT